MNLILAKREREKILIKRKIVGYENHILFYFKRRERERERERERGVTQFAKEQKQKKIKGKAK